MKEVKNMSDKELKEEWKSVDYHIKHFSYGRFELNYRAELEAEMNKRRTLE